MKKLISNNFDNQKTQNMIDKKMTAIEWLVDQLEKYELYSKISFQCLKEIEQAKEMEKEQIETAYNAKKVNYYPHNDLDISAEQYYTETYEQ